jgi:hypothetical protein
LTFLPLCVKYRALLDRIVYGRRISMAVRTDGVQQIPDDDQAPVQQAGESTARLSKFEEWLKTTGRKKTWFARAIGYSYQALWCKITGFTGLTDDFVVKCFQEFPDMPADIFADQGYTRRGDFVYRWIPLHPES